MITRQDKRFNILLPQPGLRKDILYYNILFPGEGTFTAQYTPMPNACGTLSLAFDGVSVKAELWGATTVPVPIGAEPNRYSVLFLIQLSPYGLYQITRQNQMEFADRRLSLAEVDSGLFGLLDGAFARSKDIVEMANACDRILHRRMEKRVVSQALQSAVTEISASHGQMKVKEAAQRSCYSERHLNRLFHTQIGMGMKEYARIARFRYVCKLLQKTPGRFADLSQQAGYHDQAHFDKDFKAISGVSPQTYVKTMSDFYYDGTEISRTISSKEEKK